MTKSRFTLKTLATLALCLSLPLAAGAQRAEKVQQQKIEQIQRKPQGNPYTTFYYKSGDLNIEAYLYKPAGAGPFPLVVYNHGSRAGQERVEIPFRFIAAILVPQGYAVLVPERRGYGKSDGQTFGDEVGSDIGDRMMKRFHEEASDVLAGLDYLKKGEAAADSNRLDPKPPTAMIDFKRVALMGWSHGGVVSLLAASERHEFVALVDQAGGALTWNRSPTLQNELPAAARKIKVPALCMDAENDATTNAAKEVGKAVRSSGEWEKTIIYPPFTPTSNPDNIAPGHLIFAQGVSIWQDDLLAFLKPRLEPNARFGRATPVEPLKRAQP
ncbi:MAG TPA: alpha/beta fold hydrolase [Pyrinomonadaceae bacterium]|jgi:dienelactone hydrolase|nr:alpha/beta fold hydrolase [Pyrinomonadaceae bacterium]